MDVHLFRYDLETNILSKFFIMDYADTAKVSVIGYRFVSDGAFSEKQREMILADSKVREVMNVLTENEIRDVIRNKVETPCVSNNCNSFEMERLTMCRGR